MTESTGARLDTSYWPSAPHDDIWDLTVGDLLRRVAAEVPDRIALVDGVEDPEARRSWTYAEYLAESELLARGLLQRFSPGDRIAIWAPNSADWLIVRQGITMAGMVLVAINPAYRAVELAFVLRQSGATGLFLTPAYRGFDMTSVVHEIRDEVPELREVISMDDVAALAAEGDPSTVLPEVSPTDPFQIQYTSGTTGFPKGAVLHHKGLINNSRYIGERAGVEDGDVNVNAMPMYHIGGGAVTSMSILGYRGTFVVAPAFDPALMIESLETHRGTHALLVPTMLQAVLDHPDLAKRDLSSVKAIMSGAAPVSAALVRRTKETLGCGFTILFGQTEMHGVISQTRLTDSPDDQADTVGQPVPELEVKIADPDTGAVLATGERGEICARGLATMHSYYEMPEATAATIDEEGWLHLGDLGTMDDRGFITITGRLKDMVIRGGLNIYPREIEEYLGTHPAVAEVAVLGVPDEKWGEQIAAVVRLVEAAAPPSPDELRAYCREGLAAHKAPLYWTFVSEIPCTPTGKIQKFILNEQIHNHQLELQKCTSATS
jgi:fatty-acyl-CoA synthase